MSIAIYLIPDPCVNINVIQLFTLIHRLNLFLTLDQIVLKKEPIVLINGNLTRHFPCE